MEGNDELPTGIKNSYISKIQHVVLLQSAIRILPSLSCCTQHKDQDHINCELTFQVEWRGVDDRGEEEGGGCWTPTGGSATPR